MSEWKGSRLTVRIFGASHARSVGAEMTGFPAGFSVDREKLQAFLSRRAPGKAAYASERTETDEPDFLGGVDLHSRTDGQGICLEIKNRNAKSGDYAPYRDTPRPGHADYTAYIKYGPDCDMRGGGAFSGRMTAPLCAVGGICLQYLEEKGVHIRAYISRIGSIRDDALPEGNNELPAYAPGGFPVISQARGLEMQRAMEDAKASGDSLGGVIKCMVTGVPAGLGGPLFDGMEGKLAALLFAIPAVKGVSFGAGFDAAEMRGSQNNDCFYWDRGQVKTKTNHAGGILGGISSGMPLVFSVAFKPTPSIALPQETVNLKTGENTVIALRGRHDACVVPRAVPVVEAAAAIALCDLMLEAEYE